MTSDNNFDAPLNAAERVGMLDPCDFFEAASMKRLELAHPPQAERTSRINASDGDAGQIYEQRRCAILQMKSMGHGLLKINLATLASQM